MKKVASWVVAEFEFGRINYDGMGGTDELTFRVLSANS